MRRGSAAAQRRGCEQAHDLDGQRGDVVVGSYPLSVDGSAVEPSGLHVQRLDGGAEAHVDAAASQVIDPGVDPDLARRRVEHAVGAAAHACEVLQQLDQHPAAGSGAHLPSARRHQRAREPVGEEALEGRAAALGSRELPPALALPLLVAALVATGQQGQQALHQHRVLVQRHPDADGSIAQEAGEHREVLSGLREVPRGDDLVGATGLGEQNPGRADEVVAHGPALERDSPHRVGQVAVEAGEEAKAVLARQVRPAAGARAGHRHAARLAAGSVALLMDGDVEAPLGQLVSSAEARNAAAEDRDRGHAAKLDDGAGAGQPRRVAPAVLLRTSGYPRDHDPATLTRSVHEF